MISRRMVFVLASVATAAAGVFSVACSSSDSTGSTSGGTNTKDSGAPATDSSTAAEAGIAPGSVKLAEGPCTADVDCAPSDRGAVACFIGGTGGGGGDGGGANTAYCSLKCSPTGMANTTTCAAPFLEFCNGKGYCKLH